MDDHQVLSRDDQDLDGISHTVEVIAATLYEAVARGLAATRGHEWVSEIAQGVNVIKVSGANGPVQHEVRLRISLNNVVRSATEM